MKGVGKMVGVLGLVCIVAAVALSYVYDLTYDAIQEARAEELRVAIRAVMPEFDNAPDTDKVEAGEVTYYIGRKAGAVVGVAFEVSSMQGYSGLITAMVGADPAGAVTGVSILTHAETPGLGAKFVDPGYLAQFVGKSLDNAQWKVKKDGGDFDQITGATITPRALVGAIEKGLNDFGANRDRLVGGGGQ